MTPLDGLRFRHTAAAFALVVFAIAPSGTARASTAPPNAADAVSGAWTTLTVTPDPPLFWNVVFDSHRRRLIGFDRNGPTRTWVASVDTPAPWAELSVTLPGQAHPFAVFDPEGDRALLIGNTALARLTLAGTPAWSEIAIGGTPPPPSSRWLYDPSRNRVIVLSGNDGYALDLAGTPAWTPFTTAGTPRYGDVEVYDSARDRFLFLSSDTWDGGYTDDLVGALDLGGAPTWSHVPTTGPPAVEMNDRSGIYDPVRDRVVLFGGAGFVYCCGGAIIGYTSYNQTQELSLSGTPTWQWLAPSGAPPPRYDHIAFYDRVKDQMVVQGGAQKMSRLPPPTPLYDTWALGWPSPDPSPSLDVPHALDLGLAYNGWSRTRTLAVWNAGANPLLVSNITSPDPNVGLSPTSFGVAGAQSQTVTVQWTPPAGGPLTTTLTITSNDPDTPSMTIPLTGNAVAPPIGAVGPTSLDFGTVPDLHSHQQTFVVSNSGATDLVIAAIESSDPTVTASPDSFGVAPAGSLVVTVTWTPPAPAVLDATLTLASNDPAASAPVVSTTGTALAAQNMLAAPSPLAFHNTYVGEGSSRTLTVSNSGAYDLVVSAVTSSDPRFAPSPTAFTVSPGGNQDVVVEWSPVDRGVTGATLTLASNDPDAPSQAVAMTGTAPPSAKITTDADSVHVTLMLYESEERLLHVTNTGTSPLEYFATVEPVTGPQPAGLQAAGDSDAGAVGQDDPLMGLASTRAPPRIDAVGGPDAYGYTYRDSDFGDLPFEWLDVLTIGTQLGLNGGQVLGPFPIGFAFPFHGGTFTQFYFCPHGYLSFTNGTTSTFNNTSLPNGDPSAPENMLAVFWDALRTQGWYPYYHSDGSRLVVQYPYVNRSGESGHPNSFEVILRPDGTILYQYLTLAASNLNSLTVGLQDAARNDGLQVVFNAPYLHDSLAILFQPPVPFLRASPITGTLGPDESVDLALDFSTTGLDPGEYHAVLRIHGSDSLTPVKSIPCRLTALAPVDGPVPAPGRFGLRLVGANPAALDGRVELAVPVRGPVEVSVYDVRGARVRQIARREFEPGQHSLRWNRRDDGGRRAGPGIYFIRADSNVGRAVVRLILL